MKLSFPFSRLLNQHLVLVALIVLLTGCATPQTTVQPPDIDAKMFVSKDYVVYRLQSQDSPASLAAHFLGDRNKDWIIREANPQGRFRPDEYVIIPLRRPNIGGIYDNGFQQVPVLCYHRFADDDCSSPLCVPAAIFDRQMKYLKTNGYRVITPEELLAFLEYRQPLPRKSVMITVDDGYRSVYNVAYPILKKYGFTATLFIYTNFVGVSSKAITWEQLRELKAQGFTIGSHTIAHSDLTKQGEKEDEAAYIRRLRREIIDSKKIIDEKLNQDTPFFAYPFGRANGVAAKIVHEAGYRLAATVDRGGNAFFANRYLLQRDQVLKRDMATFTKRLNTFHTISLR